MWVKVTRPSGEYTITGGLATGWSPSSTSSDATFTSATQVDPSGTSFNVHANTGSSDVGSQNWTVQIADNGSGSSPTTCTGNLGTSISGASGVTPTPTPTATPTPDVTGSGISSINVSNISDTTATISWNTNENTTGTLLYGTSTSYGSTQLSSTSKESHSIGLAGLTSNTTYHAKITTTDAFGNTSQSGDFTFATSSTSTTVTVNVSTVITPTPTPTPIPDRTPPVVTFSTDFSEIYREAPTIGGKVTDEKGIASVEYSVDDGVQWLTIDQAFQIGDTTVDFTFTPLGLFDGNYQVRIRAIDINTNEEISDPQTLVIDRLAPQLGGSIVSIGPQVITPEKNGFFYWIKGLRPRITLSAIGGPITATLTAQSNPFPLNYMTQNDLWTTDLTLDKVGEYALTSRLIDGAGNQTDQSIGTIRVIESGKVFAAGQPVANAKVSVYYFNSTLFQFLLWEGRSYEQQNPQQTLEDGSYTLLLPPGRYYMAIEALGLRPLRSEIFSLPITTPITQAFLLEKQQGVSVRGLRIPFFDLFQTQASINTTTFQNDPSPPSKLVGRQFPFFEPTTINGKPTLVTVLATWAPQASAQIDILEQLPEKDVVNLRVVMVHDSQAAVDIFAARGAYTIPMVADRDGVLVSGTAPPNLPTHYFLDRHGTITSVQYGVLSPDQIMSSFVQ